MLDIVEKHELHQRVDEPTRLDNNISDLLLTTNPDLVEKITVSPGVSDHAVVIASVKIKVKINKTPPRKVYIFSKIDEEALKRDAQSSKEEFFKI